MQVLEFLQVMGEEKRGCFEFSPICFFLLDPEQRIQRILLQLLARSSSPSTHNLSEINSVNIRRVTSTV